MSFMIFIANAGIRDPDFLYILGAQILVFISVSLFSAWLIYKLLKKYAPRLNPILKIIVAVLVTTGLIGLVGFVSQLSGL